MQIIDSFTAITNMFERAHRVRYDAINGLTIEGLTPSEARLACLALEAADREHLARLVQQAASTPARPTPPPAPVARPTMPTPPDAPVGAPHAAPEPPTPPEPPHVPTEPPTALTDDHSAPDAAPVDTAPEGASHAAPEPAPTPEVLPPRPPLPVTVEVPPRKVSSGPKKPPPRIEEYMRASLPKVGDKHEGVEITACRDHGDGGRLLVRADGVRVKLDAKGKEVTRVSGEPPDVSDVRTAEPATSIAANDTSLPPPPPEVMASQMTRDVVQYLIDNGVKERDAIVAECLQLKAKGAKAFTNSKDEEAVRRRVMSTLTVMGVG